MTATDDEARAFAASFSAFMNWVHESSNRGPAQEVVDLVAGHLAGGGRQFSVVTRDLPPYEQVNLQTALDSWSAAPGRVVAVHGVALPAHFGGVTLQQVLSGEGLPPIRLSAPDLIDLPNGPGTTLACMNVGLLLVTDELGRYVVMVRGPERHQQPTLTLEVAGLPVDAAQAVHTELAALRSRLNVYRGRVLELGTDQFGGISLLFASLPATARADVVLPEAVLRRVERHTVDMAGHRAQLQAAGQHMKRGLLLFGPPGTGKTHTVRYVVGRLTGYTVLLLSGRSLGMIGSVAALARELQPSAIVLEDVDLVAEDRGFGPGSAPVLFELLDVMDGAAADADLIFLLTTNRADLLEPALAARPGRVDVAVEVGLPDDDARRRLFDLYAARVPLDVTAADVDTVVARTAGVTASFIKELLRRAVLEALTVATPLVAVTGLDLSRALDEMLDSSQQITRALISGTPEGGSPAQPWVARGGVHGGMVGAMPGVISAGMPTAYGSASMVSYSSE